MEGNDSSLTCSTMPVKYQSTRSASWVRSEPRTFWIQS